MDVNKWDIQSGDDNPINFETLGIKIRGQIGDGFEFFHNDFEVNYKAQIQTTYEIGHVYLTSHEIIQVELVHKR
jgi:hypothetical protein